MPTQKQKLAAKLKLENVGMAVSEIMRDAGYSDAMAKNPQKLTESNGWAELMEQYLPDEKLARKHGQLLEAKKVISANVFPDGKDGKPINDFIEVEDNQTQIKAVELGYRVKGRIANPQGDEDPAKKTLEFRIVFEK